MKLYKKYLGLFLFGFLFSSVAAQIDSDPDAGTSAVPIDGGIVTITLIAAAYGAKRRQERKDKED